MNKRALLADGLIRVVLVLAAIILGVFIHESTHLVVGRLVGIPTRFTGLTSVGIPQAAVHLYAGWRLAMMNGVAPLLSVVMGFASLGVLYRWHGIQKWIRYFISWWAIFGIPYAGLQLMILVAPVNFSGNGADSAAVAGYFKAQPSILAALSFLGFLYYLWSCRLVLDAIRNADLSVPRAQATADIAPWRRIGGWALLIVALFGAAGFALSVYGLGASLGSNEMLAMFVGWSVACALWTRWRGSDARVVWAHWLIPGAIGLAALIPLGLVGGGNDFAQIWLIQLPPVFAATMLASRAAHCRDQDAVAHADSRRTKPPMTLGSKPGQLRTSGR